MKNTQTKNYYYFPRKAKLVCGGGTEKLVHGGGTENVRLTILDRL
jgi:hypothetical protein